LEPPHLPPLGGLLVVRLSLLVTLWWLVGVAVEAHPLGEMVALVAVAAVLELEHLSLTLLLPMQ
jgi:hypothetical protein